MGLRWSIGFVSSMMAEGHWLFPLGVAFIAIYGLWRKCDVDFSLILKGFVETNTDHFVLLCTQIPTPSHISYTSHSFSEYRSSELLPCTELVL